MVGHRLVKTYPIKTYMYVLLHFEHESDITIIIKLLYRAMSHVQVALWSLMISVIEVDDLLSA